MSVQYLMQLQARSNSWKFSMLIAGRKLNKNQGVSSGEMYPAVIKGRDDKSIWMFNLIEKFKL